MGLFNSTPPVKTIDTTPSSVRTLQNQANNYLLSFLNNPQGWAAGFQNPVANYANTQMAGLMSPDNNPEQQAYNQVSPVLMGLLNAGQRPPSELQFGNQFSELQNPFGDLGATNRAESTLQAALPTFDRNLQRAQASLSNAAPNRFSSRMAQEGTDLASQALNDYNLFANQALMQGQQLQSQERQNALNFMSSARGLQQQSDQNTAQNQLAARDLYQQGVGQGAQQSLNAANLIGQLAGNAGNGVFNRTLQGGTYALQQQQANMNPIMQMIAGLMGWAQPQPGTPVVGQSPLQIGSNLAQIGLMGYDILHNGNRYQQPQLPNGGSYGGGPPYTWGR